MATLTRDDVREYLDLDIYTCGRARASSRAAVANTTGVSSRRGRPPDLRPLLVKAAASSWCQAPDGGVAVGRIRPGRRQVLMFV
jgi:hypothetical protein